jgi:7-cyano-7-deazaguanine tRNA-ribosyltransferase
MERYRFDVLVDMIMTAKMNLPADRPLHLFGAGHPFMFALAVALGCDLFDSAAYAIYARQNRYMTENGTYRLNELDYFPCTCPKCAQATPKQALELSPKEREVFLAEHNLYVCSAELKRIKQAIKDGRLWEHLEMRAHTHPALLQAVKKLAKYQEFIEKHNPIAKKSGLFFFNSTSLMRPEVVRYRKNLRERYTKPEQAEILLLIPQTQTKPFHKSREYKQTTKLLNHEFKEAANKVHVCFYSAPFGIIPIELDEVYPLSQHETVLPLNKETITYVANQIADYINKTNYKTIILLHDPESWNKTVLKTCKKTCQQKRVKFRTLNTKKATSIRKFRPLLKN